MDSQLAVEFEVHDNGCGMDAETCSRVFEPFFTTKEFGHGTGLGLTTVYGIVKKKGGTIEIKSQPGGGTRVIVRLPAADAGADSPRTEIFETGSDLQPISQEEKQRQEIPRKAARTSL
jgi:signal transduction histidine kinase